MLGHVRDIKNSLGTCANGRRAVCCATFLGRRFTHTISLLTSVIFKDACPRTRVGGRIRIIVSRVRDCGSSPTRLVFSSFRGLVFRKRPLKHGVLNRTGHLHAFRDRSIRYFTQELCHPRQVVFFICKHVRPRAIYHRVRGTLGGIGISLRGRRARGSSPLARRAIPAAARQRAIPRCQPRRVALRGSARRTRVVVNAHTCDTGSPHRLDLCLLGGVLKKPNVGSHLGLDLHRGRKLICAMRDAVAYCASAKM